MNERQYSVMLYSFLPFGPARYVLLTKYFKSAKNVWESSKDALLSIGLKEKIVDDFVSYRKDFDSKSYFEDLKKQSISYVTINDPEYPENLLGLDGAPQVLYVKGKLRTQDSSSVAIVGSRKITSYGKAVASKFAVELASLGVTIVSGLALGIDAAAHRACLEVGGRTIAVLASGLDDITPRSNVWLAEKIIKSGGAIVSEYPLGTPPHRTNFPSRNRIISGLSKAVVVVEGLQKSGTLLTASSAAQQGKPLFAVPGQITSPMSGAPHYLIQNGAHIAFSSKDILDELDLQLKVDTDAMNKVMPASKGEQVLLKIIENEPMHLDEVVRISSMPTAEVSARLTVMELKGLVKGIGNGVYRKVGL